MAPCPEDIDEYWDAAIIERKAVDPRIDMIPSDFQALLRNASIYMTDMQGA